MAEADTEARRLRRELARELFADCESELQLQKQAVTDLNGQVRQLKANLGEKETDRVELESQVENLKAWIAASERARRQTFNPESAVVEAKAKADGLEKKLARSLADLDKTGRTASNANAATAEAKEEAEGLGRDIVVLTEKVERLEAERAELRKSVTSLKDEMGDAAEAAKAQISQLQSELIETKRQLQAVIAAVRDNPGD